MREGGTATAGHGVEAVAGHRDGARGRQEHLGGVAAEGDDGHHVARLVGILEERERGTLRRVHAVESHGAGGVHEEDDERAGLARQLLRPHVALLDVHLLGNLARGDGAIAARLLVGRGRSEGGVDGEAHDVTLGHDRLDVPAAVVGEDDVLGATGSAAAAVHGLGKLEHLLVLQAALGVEHELLGEVGHLVVLLLLLLLLVILLVLFVLVVLHVILGGRRGRGRRLLLVVLGRRHVHVGFGAGDDDELDSLLEIVGVHLAATIESGESLRSLDREELGAVAHAHAARRLAHEVANLFLRDFALLEPLPGEDDLRARTLRRLLGVRDSLVRGVLEVHRLVHRQHAVVEGENLVRGEGHGDAIEEVLAERALLGVERRDEQGLARVPEGDTLALHHVLTLGEHGQEEVGH